MRAVRRALSLVWASTLRLRKEVRADVVWGVRDRADVSFVQSILATAEREDIAGDGWRQLAAVDRDYARDELGWWLAKPECSRVHVLLTLKRGSPTGQSKGVTQWPCLYYLGHGLGSSHRSPRLLFESQKSCPAETASRMGAYKYLEGRLVLCYP